MKADFLFDPLELERYVKEGYVTKEAHPSGELFIYCYTQQAIDHWVPPIWPLEVQQAYGLIINKEGHIITRTYGRMFPWPAYEGAIAIQGPGSRVLDDVGGTFGVLYRDPDRNLCIATANSFVGEIAEQATEEFNQFYAADRCVDAMNIYTSCFRIIQNPEGGIKMVLDATINRTDGTERISHTNDWTGATPREFTLHDNVIQYIIEYVNEKKEDKFILVTPNSVRLSVTLDQAARWYRMGQEGTPRKIFEHIRDNRPFDALLDRLPQEFHGWAVGIRGAMLNQLDGYQQTAEAVFQSIIQEVPAGDMQAFADLANRYKYPHHLFAIRDQRDYSTEVFKLCEPPKEDPYKRPEDRFFDQELIINATG